MGRPPHQTDSGYAFALAARMAPELRVTRVPPKRVQETPGALGTRSPCASIVSTRSSPRVPRITRRFPRNGFTAYAVLSSATNSFLSPSPRGSMVGRTRLGRRHLHRAWHQQRMPGPHGFAVRSDLHQSSQRTMCCPQSFGEGVEAPFVLRAARSLTENRPAITSRARRCRVHRILPRVRDDRDTPLSWGGRRSF